MKKAKQGRLVEVLVAGAWRKVEDVCTSKFGSMVYFYTEEGFRWLYQQELVASEMRFA